MTDYRATPGQWAYQEHWAQEDGDAACILELRARVEALEANTKAWREDHLRLANTCAGMAEDRLEFFGKLLPDGESDPEGEIIDYYSKLAAQHPGKATFHQDLSLVERIAGIICDNHAPVDLWYDDARAAINEVARWIDAEARERGMQPHNGVYSAADWLRGELEREAQR